MMPQRVRPGDDFNPSATDWNSFCDTTDAVFGTDSGGRATERGSPLLVLNDTISNVARLGILALREPVIDFSVIADSDQRAAQLLAWKFASPTIKGKAPSMPADAGRWVVLLEPADINRTARCLSAGVIQVQLDVVSESDKWAEAIHGDTTKLRTGGFGSAQVLWKESGTGTKWGIISFPAVGAGLALYRLNSSHQGVPQKWDTDANDLADQPGASAINLRFDPVIGSSNGGNLWEDDIVAVTSVGGVYFCVTAGRQFLMCELDEDLEANGTATASVLDNDGADTGVDVEVRDTIGLDGTIGEGTVIYAQWLNIEWVYANSVCNT